MVSQAMVVVMGIVRVMVLVPIIWSKERLHKRVVRWFLSASVTTSRRSKRRSGVGRSDSQRRGGDGLGRTGRRLGRRQITTRHRVRKRRKLNFRHCFVALTLLQRGLDNNRTRSRVSLCHSWCVAQRRPLSGIDGAALLIGTYQKNNFPTAPCGGVAHECVCVCV